MLFKQALDIVKCKNHLNPEGLSEIVSIKATMNKKVSVSREFPLLKPKIRPVNSVEYTIDPY